MTASQLVAPIGLPLPIRGSPLLNPGQILRAKRNLFGVSNSEETERLFREDELRRLEHLQRYVIITDQDNVAESTEANDQVAEPVREASVEVAEPAPEASVEVAEPTPEAGDDGTEPPETGDDSTEPSEAGDHGTEPTNDDDAASVNASDSNPAEANNDYAEPTAGPAHAELVESNEANNDIAQPVRYNPGPLGYFRVRKTVRGKPYELRAPKDCFHPPRSSRV